MLFGDKFGARLQADFCHIKSLHDDCWRSNRKRTETKFVNTTYSKKKNSLENISMQISLDNK